ncbi:MAG: carbohydrate kinase family protein [Burkholderiaceae bacterium]|jgi:adenosine kinase
MTTKVAPHAQLPLIQVSGSIAFDTIMVFEGRFKDHILSDQVHMLNVAFLTPQMRQEFGGCAANIAYGLVGLGAQVAILGALGRDGHAYNERLTELGVDMGKAFVSEDHYTAQAFITTDLDDNQITAFHPGAMEVAWQSQVITDRHGLGIVSPNGKQAMLGHAEAFAAAGIPFVFDPGQGLPMFSKQDLLGILGKASWLAVNDYEGEMLSRCIEMPLSEARGLLWPHPTGGVVITRGAQGVRVIAHDREESLPAMRVDNPVDPTGCGDAFRAGLLWALSEGYDLTSSCRAGVIMGGIKVQSRGAQNHLVDRNQILAVLS